MLVQYYDVHLKTAASLTAYCYTVNSNVLRSVQVLGNAIPVV
jgi:hypothetical protein